MVDSKQAGVIEKIAGFSAGAIIIAAAVYWTIQIIGMFEFLELAYG